jgi:hypothetical protein
MRMGHVLLMGSFVVTGPALSADPDPASETRGKPAREAKGAKPPAGGSMASDDGQRQSTQKRRVHRTFPPPTRPL